MPSPSTSFSAFRALSRLTRSAPRFARSPLPPIRPILLKPQPQFLSTLHYRPYSDTTTPWSPLPPSQDEPSSSSPPHPSQPYSDDAIPWSSPTPSPPSEDPPRAKQPEYELTFTCNPCGQRSTHRITKQGYHKGSVLITCPGCRNRHVISDHLQIFGDRNLTIEDLMREQGQIVKKGTLSEDGDVEFWSDGRKTPRGEGAGLAQSDKGVDVDDKP